MAPTVTRITAGPVALARYDWGGPADGEPVLLAHPTGFNGLVWAPVAERLVARGLRVWSFDFRGHGGSDRPAAGYAWDGFAADTVAVAASIGVGPVVGVGISKGAAALMLAAANDPQPWSRLWCYEPIVFPPGAVVPGARNPMAEAARRRRRRWSSPDEMFAAYSARPPMSTLHPDARRGYVAAGLRPDGDGWTLACDPDDEAQIYELGLDNGVYDVLGHIEVPVTVLAGEHTDTVTPAWAEAIAAPIPHHDLVVWSKRGHFGPLEDPERGAADIARFAVSG